MTRKRFRRVAVTIEARMASERLPGKVMLPLAGEPMLQRLVERARRASSVDLVIVATTDRPADRIILDLCDRIGCPVHAGPVDDITERLLGAARRYDADVLVQLTGDNPLVDPGHIDATVALLHKRECDYAANNLVPGLPIGFDVRAFRVAALERSSILSSDPVDRVHGSYFLARHPDLFSQAGWTADDGALRWPDLRLTVDEPADYELVRRTFETLHAENRDFRAEAVVALLRRHPDWVALNATVRQKAAAEK
ncbi:hypothetical protein C1S70_30240 (plasmid) [Azospirillum argentinense]|uniref:Spore coat protein n=2 Tax=Azospirillum argentinense TaxID=2970906 RepID=A0A2K1FRT0_9PROT|nr:hypothetical protein C1S70_30240 [Azospirillum argentinense]